MSKKNSRSSSRHRTRGAAKSKSQRQSAARHGAAGPSFPRLPRGIRTLKKKLLAARRKQPWQKPEQPKEYETVLRHDGTPEGLREVALKAYRWADDLTARHIFQLALPRLLPKPGTTTTIPIRKTGSTPGTVIELRPGWRVEWSPGRRVFCFGSQKEILIYRRTGRLGEDELAEAAWLLYREIKAANPREKKPWQRIAKALNEQRPDETIAEAGKRLRRLVKAWRHREKRRTSSHPQK